MKNRTYWIFAVFIILTVSIAYSLSIKPKEKKEPQSCTSTSNIHSESEFKLTIENTTSPPSKTPKGMVWIPGGEFSMGSNVEGESLCSIKGVTKDASPVHRVYVDGYFMDETEVTNEEFAKFVKATNYVTIAEQKPTKEEFPTAREEDLITGSIVFTQPTHRLI